jgi:hypothetical protein
MAGRNTVILPQTGVKSKPEIIRPAANGRRAARGGSPPLPVAATSRGGALRRR